VEVDRAGCMASYGLFDNALYIGKISPQIILHLVVASYCSGLPTISWGGTRPVVQIRCVPSIKDGYCTVYTREAWRFDEKGWYVSRQFSSPQPLNVRSCTGLSRTHLRNKSSRSGGPRTSSHAGCRSGQPDNLLLRRVAGRDMPRCCKERTCLTREGRKRKGHSCGAGRSGLEKT